MIAEATLHAAALRYARAVDAETACLRALHAVTDAAWRDHHAAIEEKHAAYEALIVGVLAAQGLQRLH